MRGFPFRLIPSVAWMNVSEHLLVLLSIIIGLAITELLTGVRQLIRARNRIRLHWLPLTWAVGMFLVLVQDWWVLFIGVQKEQWSQNFFAFLYLLQRSVLLYLASSSLLPDPTEMEETTSLLGYYLQGRVWVFGLLALFAGEAAVQTVVMRGRPLTSLGVVIQFVLFLLVISLAWSRSVRFHAIITGALLALFVFFIVQFTLQLPG